MKNCLVDLKSLGSYDTETDSDGYVKITEEDYDPNLVKKKIKLIMINFIK